jgi:uncharacterized protein (TIGR02118 family)
MERAAPGGRLVSYIDLIQPAPVGIINPGAITPGVPKVKNERRIVKREGMMHKLVILIEDSEGQADFDEAWPQFLHLSERMPGLAREATSRIEQVLYGRYHPVLMHELFFESFAALQQAMTSPEGRAAGELLQTMTGGKLTLLLAEHKEDDLDHIRSFSQPNPGNE